MQDERENQPRWTPLLTQAVVTLFLVLLGLGALVGAGYLAYSNLLYAQTDRGNCSVLFFKSCTSLSRGYIELEIIGYPLPEAVSVQASGSLSKLKYAEEWVLLRSGSASDFDDLPGSSTEMGATPSLPTEVLVERGFSEVTQKRLLNDGSGNYTLSHVGIDKSGQSLAFILKFYDF